ERFVISSDSSDHSGTNVVDAKVDSVIRSLAPPSPLMTTTVTTTDVAGALSAPAPGAGAKPMPQVQPYLFLDSSSTGAGGPDVAGFL
ncbi:hypothetical protein Tco_1339259, partial [Tanacetum coccineum]